jgi:hypothetical protein
MMETTMNDSEHLTKLESIVSQIVSSHNFLSTTMLQIVDKLDEQKIEVDAPAQVAGDVINSEQTKKPVKKQKNHIKPSSPSDLNGNHKKGCTFLNSCKLYIRLASNQFVNDTE